MGCPRPFVCTWERACGSGPRHLPRGCSGSVSPHFPPCTLGLGTLTPVFVVTEFANSSPGLHPGESWAFSMHQPPPPSASRGAWERDRQDSRDLERRVSVALQHRPPRWAPRLSSTLSPFFPGRGIQTLPVPRSDAQQCLRKGTQHPGPAPHLPVRLRHHPAFKVRPTGPKADTRSSPDVTLSVVSHSEFRPGHTGRARPDQNTPG